jgi:hypothetical protein
LFNNRLYILYKVTRDRIARAKNSPIPPSKEERTKVLKESVVLVLFRNYPCALAPR